MTAICWGVSPAAFAASIRVVSACRDGFFASCSPGCTSARWAGVRSLLPLAMRSVPSRVDIAPVVRMFCAMLSSAEWYRVAVSVSRVASEPTVAARPATPASRSTLPAEPIPGMRLVAIIARSVVCCPAKSAALSDAIAWSERLLARKIGPTNGVIGPVNTSSTWPSIAPFQASAPPVLRHLLVRRVRPRPARSPTNAYPFHP
ncbi:Uncharacterised protein [Mycobacteroides abscessus]|nr:Uncharacterised protein [Mycobacteroides abscessus]